MQIDAYTMYGILALIAARYASMKQSMEENVNEWTNINLTSEEVGAIEQQIAVAETTMRNCSQMHEDAKKHFMSMYPEGTKEFELYNRINSKVVVTTIKILDNNTAIMEILIRNEY